MLEFNENNKNLCGIYCISNTINDKVYIGSTNCFYPRKRQHFLELKGNYHTNPKLQNFVNKYGIETLHFNILEITKLEELKIKEQFYLDSISNKFNICVKADRPNVNRNFTEEDIKNIANLYNSGKCSTEISRIYFDKKSRQNYITSIIKGEIYSEYKHLFNIYRPKTNKSFSERDIIKIAELYNSGKTGCQISEILYNTRNRRAKINSLIKGKNYKEYAHLFNYRVYTQLNKKRK
jgi:group I intron endonuclease